MAVSKVIKVIKCLIGEDTRLDIDHILSDIY